MSSIIVMLMTGFPTKPVSELYGFLTPMRSNPALQNAETEWKMLYQSPRPIPKILANTGSITTAPRSSAVSRNLRINRASRTIPPT